MEKYSVVRLGKEANVSIAALLQNRQYAWPYSLISSREEKGEKTEGKRWEKSEKECEKNERRKEGCQGKRREEQR